MKLFLTSVWSKKAREREEVLEQHRKAHAGVAELFKIIDKIKTKKEAVWKK